MRIFWENLDKFYKICVEFLSFLEMVFVKKKQFFAGLK